MYKFGAKLMIPNEQEVAPFFQPILSLQTQKIIAYEALGRWVRNGKAQSLGPFFHDSSTGDADHLRIDRLLRNEAMRRLVESDTNAKLFINLKPSWIYRMYQETGELSTLRLIAKNGLDPSRIVIEITEEEFAGRLDELTAIIGMYRREGCLIAIDDIGSGYSNYDRIASIRPHILKMDLKLLRMGAIHSGYNEVMNSFSILAAEMGASLLVEGVETKHDLYHALKVGARYVQGYLFSEAKAEFQPEGAFETLLKEQIAIYTEREMDRYRNMFSVQNSLGEVIRAATAIHSSEDADALIGRLLEGMEDNVVRMYICFEDGRQISSNFTRLENGQWVKDERFRGSNWIWRPYFIPTMLQMKQQQQGFLSQVYADLETSRPIQTYSCPVGEMQYLFLDLMV